jgi:hypothetical protein
LLAFRHPRHAAQVFDAPFGNDRAEVDDGHAGAHLLDDLEGVRGHEHGHAVGCKVLKNVLHELCTARVQPDHGLIHHEHPWAVKQGGGHDQALLHAVRKAFDQLVLPVRQPE